MSEPFWNSRAFFLASVALPVVGYLASIGMAEASRAGAPRIEVAIEGYDPRDPIRGHYLMFRLKTERVGEPSTSSSEADFRVPSPFMTYEESACLGPEKDGISVIYRFTGESPSVCRRSLSADFVRDSHRFYVQQDAGSLLEKALLEDRASVILILEADNLVVESLKIDGEPWTQIAP